MNNLYSDTSGNKPLLRNLNSNKFFLCNFNKNYTNQSEYYNFKVENTKLAITSSVSSDSDSIILEEPDFSNIDLKQLKFASEKALSKLWDDPEEDNAWKEL